MQYENWWSRHKLFQVQLKDIFSAWKRDQDDFILHAKSLFHQACVEYEKKHKTMINNMKQRFACNFLHEKVRRYSPLDIESLQN